MSVKVKTTPYYVAAGRIVGGSTPAPNALGYSLDGISWTPSTLPSVGLGKVAFGQNKFVGIPADNTNVAAYSTDGITWTETNLPSAQSWNSVAYGNEKFVALAISSNVAAYSTDGITWTATTLPASENWLSVAYGDGRFVAIARNSSTNAYSTDGITWNAGTMPSGLSWQQVAYGAGKFVALVNGSSSFAYSNNGITWTLGFMPSSQDWNSLAYGDGKFVAIVNNSSTSAYSLDGISWTGSNMPSSRFWGAITYGNGKFVALAYQSTTTAYSTDGITWSTSTITTASGWSSIIYGELVQTSTSSNGVWKDLVAPYVKVAGAWKIARSAFIKVSGQWRSWFLQGGLLDTSFNSAGADAFVRSIVVQPDGKILVGGDFSTFNGSSVNSFVRLNANGTLDTSFMANLSIGVTYSVSAIDIQTDGKILLGGSFLNFGGILRLNSNGTLDSSFNNNLGTGVNNQVADISLQADGKIVVVGSFTTFNGVTTRRIVRINSNGTVDTAFRANNTGAFNSGISTVAIQPNGQIIVGGGFTNFNGVNTNRIARLNSDGTEDTVFRTNIGTGATEDIQSIAIKSDGKILVGGNFWAFNGVNRDRLAVLNNTGVLDTSSTFVTNIGVGPNSTVSSITFQPDEKVILGGSFSFFNGTAVNRIVRLNADGTRDTQFTTNLGTSVNSFLFTVASQPDNKLLLGGNFTSFNSQSYNRIVRIGGEVSVA